jgi:hypothetical protein
MVKNAATVDDIECSEIAQGAGLVQVASHSANPGKPLRQKVQADLPHVNRNHRASERDVESGVIAGSRAQFKNAGIGEGKS